MGRRLGPTAQSSGAPAPSGGGGPRTWVLDPAGDLHYWWLSIMVLPIMYNWILLICRSCFPDVQQQHLGVWLSLDYLSDLLYLLDIGVRLHTVSPQLHPLPWAPLPAGFLEQGILVQDRARIWRHYLRSAPLLWDVASVLPTDLLYLRLGLGVPAVRANRLLRTPRLFEAFDRQETRTAHPYAFRIAKLMLYVFVAIHWNACAYFALSGALGYGSDTWVYPNHSEPGFGHPLRQYLYSFYFSTLILTTVGNTPDPQRQEEFLFMVADFLMAVMGFASIMGSMSSVISTMSAAEAAFYPDGDRVKGYLRLHRVAGRLERRVLRWHQHLHLNKKVTDELRVLQHLPERLRAEVAVSVHLATLRKVQLFQTCEQSLLEELVLKLRPQVYSPDEYVCRKGDIGREMYFIREGRLAVVGDDGRTQYAVLGEGLYFGNKSGNRRTANIKSIGYSDLFCLSKEDLREVLAEFPAAQAVLEAKGREILQRMDKLDLHAEEAELEREAAARRRTAALEQALDALQTKFARLLAELESSALRLALRIERLEWQRGWAGGEGAGPRQ
ncbi:cyclic nucleotide-gated channel alpha-4-like isoform X2 [Pelodiscus sinensis]|uniref:cyclic nucleotide-gated channel alpha-4-like isoform X2 n=1 Tax=Pelodiscus sinensis TaxID=13735 RepID=UPI003F6A86A0